MPYGYTASHGATPTMAPTVVVPAITQLGDLSFYNDIDAFTNPPACGPDGNARLQPNEAAVAIGWELFDSAKAGQGRWPEPQNALWAEDCRVV